MNPIAKFLAEIKGNGTTTSTLVRTERGRKLIGTAIKQAGWTYCSPNEPLCVPKDKSAPAIGIATWVDEEVAILSELYDKNVFGDTPPAVFDIDSCRDVTELQLVAPNTEIPICTPLVSLYSAGRFVDSYSGDAAIQYLTTLLNSPKEEP